MGKKCCVTGCRSGYARTSAETKEGEPDGRATEGQGSLPRPATDQGAEAGILPETAAAAEGTVSVTGEENRESASPGI